MERIIMKKKLEIKNSGNLPELLEKSKKELMEIRSTLASGGSISDPGRIKFLKRKIARILTYQNNNSLK